MADQDDATRSTPAIDDATRSSAPVVADATRSSAPMVASTPATPFAIDETFVDEPEAYSVRGCIGAGGMGTVLAAQGARLGRPVALKVVTADREDLRRRFEREAQVTARLQHPAIVPVYGSGRGRSGQPFYAMKQVTGEPLDKVIAKAETLAQRIALLPNVIAVSEAIAYAHAERVIHRDLKPANILVGAFGETVVIDWGLAKDLAQREEIEASLGDSASPYRASGDETGVGKVMGTPAYMPVEQARGERVDERADVYALGAILYHVLAGVQPYLREDERSVPWESMVARVLSGEPARLATRQPDAPPDLVAIVERAMAREAGARYPSAGELAADLRRFQTGQLVGAHRYSTWQLVRRWLRRHRAAVSVGAALLMVLAVVSMVSVQRIRRERSDAEVARAVAVDQRALAEANRNRAEDLMSFMLGDLKDKLQPVGKLDILDAVAKQTMAYYQSQPDTGSEAERKKRAQAFINVGDVLQPQGNLDGALGAFRAGLAIREAFGGRADLIDAAIAHYRIGTVLDLEGDDKGALVEDRAGLALAERAATGDPNPEFQFQIADGEVAVSGVLVAQGDLAGAHGELEKGLAIRARLVTSEPANPRWLRSLATGYVRLGDLEDERGNVAATLEAFRTAKTYVQQLSALDPKNSAWRRDLTVPFERLGNTLLRQHEVEAALVEYRAGLAITEQLVARDSTNTEWLRDEALAHRHIASALASSKDPAAALVEFRRAVELSGKLAKLDAANAQWSRDLAAMHQVFGIYLGERGDAPGALDELAASRAIAEPLAKAYPNNVTYAIDVAALHNNVGNLLSDSNVPAKVRESIPEFEAAIAGFAKIVAKDPDNFEHLRSLADSYQNLGNAYSTVTDPKAVEPYKQALAIYDRLVAAQPSNHEPEVSACQIHFNLGELGKSQDEYRTANAIIEHLLKSDPKDPLWLAMQAEIKKRLR